jgi:hypothetical protein
MDPLSFLLNARLIVALVARLLLSPVSRTLFRSKVYSRVEAVFILDHYVAWKLVTAVGEALGNAYPEPPQKKITIFVSPCKRFKCHTLYAIVSVA